MSARHVAVLDVGKTNVKLALVDLQDLSEIEVLSRPNAVINTGRWPHYDIDAHWQFFVDGLGKLQASHGIDAISVTTHGVCCVFLDTGGELAAPVLDYEHKGIEETADAYNLVRPSFAETGSPRLNLGLNLGSQLFWQFTKWPDLYDRVASILTYPQYWAYRLTGVQSCEVTSLGCHTDLWLPGEGQVSQLVDHLGLSGRFAPIRNAGESLGTILPDLAGQTGIAPDTPVYCGIHDSNASLLPHLADRTPPFSVVSSGTWTIIMSVGGNASALDPVRDTLMNVNAYGDPVPSARFMGGREYELLMGGAVVAKGDEGLGEILSAGIMLLPSVVPEFGPYQGRRAKWVGTEPGEATAERQQAVSLYLALMTATCLELTGHKGDIVVEGPFARNETYLRMLSAAANAPVAPCLSNTGTSIGAALLADPARAAGASPEAAVDESGNERLLAYALEWRQLANA